MSATAAISADSLICRCLQVRASVIQDCVSVYGLQSVPEIKAQCGAGGGCNGCHRRIRDMIAAHRRQAETGGDA